MSVTASAIVGDGDGDLRSDAAARRAGALVESLVARLHAQYGGDPRAIRTQVTDVLAGFAGARVQAFVPILVEKRVREIFRGYGSRPHPAAQPADAANDRPRTAVVRPLRT